MVHGPLTCVAKPNTSRYLSHKKRETSLNLFLFLFFSLFLCPGSACFLLRQTGWNRTARAIYHIKKRNKLNLFLFLFLSLYVPGICLRFASADRLEPNSSRYLSHKKEKQAKPVSLSVSISLCARDLPALCFGR